MSFDGRRVLFAGKQKAGDAWQIWEVELNGGVPRRIVSGKDDLITPFYLPAEKVVYARRTPQGFQLEIAPVDGSMAALRLTYAPGDHIATDVLRDGRILFEAPFADAARDLFTVYSDGSGVETHRCDHGHDRHSGRELSPGDIVFEAGGRLARFTSARAVELALAMAPGEFAGPVAEIAPGDWLVAYRPSAGQPFALYEVKPDGAAPRKILAVNGADMLQPVIVRPREAPKWHPSSLGNREGANALCLNAYTSKARIPENSVAAVRVWAQNDAGQACALGEAPVERDGSFYVQVPSERAIRFELLDRNKRTVAAEKGWFWMRRGEQRVCVGCHAGPERAPDNAVPQVLLRTQEPARMELPK